MSQVVHPPPGWVLVGPELLRWLLSAAEPTLARIAREGGRLPPDVAADLEALRAVCGPVAADQARSWLSTAEAAELLGVDVRTVQRLAKGWTHQRVAGALLVDADDVAAEVVARRHAGAGRTTPDDTRRQADERAA